MRYLIPSLSSLSGIMPPRSKSGIIFPTRPGLLLAPLVQGSPGGGYVVRQATWGHVCKFPVWPAIGRQTELARGSAPSIPAPPDGIKEVFIMTRVNRTRPYTWSIRLSAEELRDVQKRVKESGRTKRDFALHAFSSIKIINDYGLCSLLPELRHIGNNLNQLAHRCNQGDQPTYREIEKIRKELSELWQSLRQLAVERR